MKHLTTSQVAIALLVVSACASPDSEPVDRTRDVANIYLADLYSEHAEQYDQIVWPEPYYPPNARQDQIKALQRANWYRTMCSLPPLDMLEEINNAAQAHSEYYAKHADKYKSSGLSPHDENPSWPDGYTGSSPTERMAHFGYNHGVSEVIAFVHNPELAVDGWMATLYHRIPFMDASVRACGYGAAGSGFGANSTAIDTMDFGSRGADGQEYNGPLLEGIYPPPGSSGIPILFDGAETPQPPPPPTGYPSGTIISITWSEPTGFAPIEYALWEEDSQTQLDVVWVDPQNDPNLAGSNTVAMYAYKPLKKGTKYWVHIKGKRNGQDYERTWYFITERY